MSSSVSIPSFNRHKWLNPMLNGPRNHLTELPVELLFPDTDGLVYCSDMVKHYGDTVPISDANPTGSRVSSQGLVLSFDGKSLKNHAGGADGVASGGVNIGGAVGVRGPATSFDGVDDKIAFGSLAATEFSVHAVFERTRTTAYEAVFMLGNFYLRMVQGEATADIYTGFGSSGFPNGGKATDKFAVSIGKHDIDVVWTSTYVKVYLDGALVIYNTGTVDPASFTGPLTVGASATTTNPFAGTISELDVWGRLLTQTEVRQLYEDTYGWVENKANPHCKDIDTAHPLGSDRDVLLNGANTTITDANPTGSRVSKDGLVLSFDGSSLRNHAGGADGVASGGVALGGVMGPRGPVTAPDGVDDKIVFSGLPSQAQGCIFATVYHRSTAIGSPFSYRNAAQSAGPFFDDRGNNTMRVCFTGATGMPNGWYGNAFTLTANAYHQLAMVWTANSYWFYIDGACVESVVGACSFPALSPIPTLGALGTNYSSDYLAEAYAWSRAITQTEIREMFEDFWGHWSSRDSNPHCLDISDEHPLGTDRVSDDGLVLSLDMETLTPDGKLYDFSRLGNDANLYWAPTYQIGKVKNGAYLFNGTTQYLSGTGISISDELTYFIVVKPTSLNSGAFYECINGNSGIMIRNDANGAVNVVIGDGSAKTATKGSDGKIIVGQSNIVAVTIKRNGTNSDVSIYINGTLDVTNTIARVLSGSSASLYYIVRDWASSGQYIPGLVGQIGLWSRCLSADEIATLTTDAQKASGLGQGLVLSLDMETLNANGTMRDMSGQGNHATVNGAKYQRSGIKNGCYLFDGASTKFMAPSIQLGSAFTLVASIRPTATLAGQGIMASAQGSNAGWAFELDLNNKPQFRFGTGTTVQSPGGTTAVVLNAASILAVTYQQIDASNSQITFYLNGALDRQATVTGVLSNGTGPAYVGLDAYFSGKYFTGTIGPVAVFNRALSADEIQKLFIDGQKMLGLVQGNPASVPGQVGSAVDLDGNTQYVRVDNCPALSTPIAMTMGAWLNNDAINDSGDNPRAMWTLSSSENKGMGIYRRDASGKGAVLTGDGASSYAAETPAPLPSKKWAFLVGVAYGAQTICYLDGAPGSLQNYALVNGTTQALFIGCSPIPGNFYDGRIAFPFIFNKAKSALWIKQLMLRSFRGREYD